MFNEDDDIEFINLARQFENHNINENSIIDFRKKLGNILSDSKKVSKLPYCYHCGKNVSSHCNSHSVPQCFLKNISVNGEVNYSNKLIGLPALDEDKGINQAGTFSIICRECDKTIFSAYENTDKFENFPNVNMIAQIAMKNYLKYISKRRNEIALYENMNTQFGIGIELQDELQKVSNMDLDEYEKAYLRAKKINEKKWNNEYNVFFYEKLDYIVPIAFQGIVSLVVDLEDKLINDIFHHDPNYKISEIHICVFPLKETSIVMMFVDKNHKRYRDFYKKFRKLDDESKLSVINYIIFLYSEDYFLSKSLDESVAKDVNLIASAGKTPIAVMNSPELSALDLAVKEFSLTKHNSIPNLLSREFAISNK